jgi:hypothetical protein
MAKYRLAESLYAYVGWLTSYNAKTDELLITNLCNSALPHAPKGKTILIPEEEARKGAEKIKRIIKSGNVQLVLAMSLQVNYWLQKVGVYTADGDFLMEAAPKIQGIEGKYYKPVSKSPFIKICGKKYYVGSIPLFPILHVIQYPFRRAIKAKYEPLHRKCIDSIKEVLGVLQ